MNSSLVYQFYVTTLSLSASGFAEDSCSRVHFEIKNQEKSLRKSIEQVELANTPSDGFFTLWILLLNCEPRRREGSQFFNEK